MTSEFFPSDRELDSADARMGGFAGAGFVEDAAVGEVSDHWIDEALRTVPLPAGFLTRMSLLAQSVQSDSVSTNLA
jgi:hypothetical protein